MDINNIFAVRLRELVAYKGLKQADFCRLTGMKSSDITRYLQGMIIAKDANIVKIANACHIDPDWLRGYDVPMIKGTEEETTVTNLSPEKQQLINAIKNMDDSQIQKLRTILDLVK